MTDKFRQFKRGPHKRNGGPVRGTDGPVRENEGPGTRPLLIYDTPLSCTRSSNGFDCQHSRGSLRGQDYRSWPDLTHLCHMAGDRLSNFMDGGRPGMSKPLDMGNGAA